MERGRQRQRGRERDGERERERDADRERGRQTEGETGRNRDREIKREREVDRQIEKERQTEREEGSPTYRKTDALGSPRWPGRWRGCPSEPPPGVEDTAHGHRGRARVTESPPCPHASWPVPRRSMPAPSRSLARLPFHPSPCNAHVPQSMPPPAAVPTGCHLLSLNGAGSTAATSLQTLLPGDRAATGLRPPSGGKCSPLRPGQRLQVPRRGAETGHPGQRCSDSKTPHPREPVPHPQLQATGTLPALQAPQLPGDMWPRPLLPKDNWTPDRQVTWPGVFQSVSF